MSTLYGTLSITCSKTSFSVLNENANDINTKNIEIKGSIIYQLG